MRHRRFGVVVLALLGTAVQLPSSVDAQAGRRRSVEGEIVVKYREGTADAAHARARGRARAQLKKRHLLARGRADETVVDVLSVAPSEAASAIAALKADPAVEHAESNLIYRPSAPPNDPYFNQLWALNNTGQAVGSSAGIADADTDTLEAWAQGVGSPQVYVAVLDQGIDIAHEDLGADPYGPIWTNPYDRRDGFDNDGNGYVDDVHGFDFVSNDTTVYDGNASAPWMEAHGTHIAGTIGARPNNGVGIAGVNWDVRIIPLKFMGPEGGTTDAAVRAIDYIVDLKIRHGLNIVAINASWGSPGFSQILLEAIARAAREDILFVAAAGNGGPDDVGDDNDQVPEYPASYDPTPFAGWDSVISVAATGQWDDLPSFSNFGARSVDLGAPGVSILSTAPQGRYTYSNGTSMATAHVTGAAALISASTGLTGRQLRARLLAGVDRRATLQGVTTTGGRLNVLSALTAASSPSAAPLPAPWQSRDVGAVGVAGASSMTSGRFSVSGGGADVWGTADAFHFVYQNLSGDGSITARVSSVQHVHAWTKAGVMIRASLSPAAAHAFMLVSPGKGLAFQRRAGDGAESVHTAGSLSAAPRWVRISRSGQTVRAFESADGLSWALVGSTSLALGATAHVGLAVSSHIAGTAAEAVFENVRVEAGTPSAWSNGDIGEVGRAGSASVNGSAMAVSASGADIWGTADQLHYVYQPLTGDGTIVARVTSIQNSHPWVKAGVMIRGSLAAGSAQAMMLVTPGGTKGLAFQRRLSDGALSTSTAAGTGTAPAWVRLARTGNVITASRSSDGVNWTVVGSDSFVVGQTVYVGIALTSHDNTVLATAMFDNITIGR